MIPVASQYSLKQNILIAALCAVSITIPLHNRYNSIALIFLVFACVIQRPLKQAVSRLAASRLWIIPVLYTLLLACSYFWDTSGGYRSRDLERYSIFFFLPPAMALLPPLTLRQIKWCCMSFVGITTLITLICLVKSYLEYQVTGDYRVFYYHYLGRQMDLNAVFLSNYCLASISWLLYFTFIEPSRKSVLTITLSVLAAVFLLAAMFLLSSKLLLFLAALVLMVFILYIGWMKRRLFWSLLIIGLIAIAGLMAISRLPYLNWRIHATEVKRYAGGVDDQNGLAIRLLMWRSAWELIQQRPLLGYGIRGGRQAILEKYKEKGFELGYKEGYHSHNQYLETTLMTGIPGFVLLMAMLIIIAWGALRTGNLLLMIMLGHFMIQSLIESTFEVQQELSFYLFFIFFFYYQPPSLKFEPRLPRHRVKYA